MCVCGWKCPAEGQWCQPAPWTESGSPPADQRRGDKGVETRRRAGLCLFFSFTPSTNNHCIHTGDGHFWPQRQKQEKTLKTFVTISNKKIFIIHLRMIKLLVYLKKKKIRCTVFPVRVDRQAQLHLQETAVSARAAWRTSSHQSVWSISPWWGCWATDNQKLW